METKAMKVGYRLVRNATATAATAPYLGVAVPVGSLAYGNILQRMLDRGTFMTFATAKYFLNEFYEFAAERIADDIVRINMGAVSIYPMIGGSFDSEDDEFRAPRNTLYVGATLSQDIRNAVSGISPASLGSNPANGTVKISSVMDLASETYHLIDGQKEFRIVGIDLTVPDGEDESLELVAADGVTKVSDITVVSTEDGQRIVCTLASAVPAGTCHVRLVSHGLDPTAPLVTALHRVTMLAADVLAPTLTYCHSEEHTEESERNVVYEGYGLEFVGTNLTGSTATATFQAGPEEDPTTLTVPANKLDVASQGLNAVIDGGWLADEILSSIDGGTAITFTFTTDGGTATLTAHKAE